MMPVRIDVMMAWSILPVDVKVELVDVLWAMAFKLCEQLRLKHLWCRAFMLLAPFACSTAFRADMMIADFLSIDVHVLDVFCLGLD